VDHLLEKATRQHTKDHNSRLVLRTIYDRGELSRADLARQTQLTRTTVSEVVGELIERGLVEEIGHGAVAVGRTPMMLSVVDDSRHVVAVSVTNDEVHGALVNLRGSLRRELRLPLPSRTGDAVLATIYSVIDGLTGSAERPLLGIGINTPGLIDTTTGTVLRTVNFGWEDLPLGGLLHERYRLPVSVANDSQTLALARYMFGQAPDTPNLVLIKVGRGIGAGIVLGGQLFSGDGYGAGEIGHMVVVEGGARCECGNYGCLETVASSAVILREASALAGADPGSALYGRATLTIADLAQAAAAGDAGLRAIVAAAGRHLAIAVANIVSVLNVRQIVITGRVAPLGDLLGDAVRAELARRALPALVRGTSVEVAPVGVDDPLVGAIAPLLTAELGLARLQRR
jgi:predicted NBD/HSP70 family sugar kinase